MQQHFTKQKLFIKRNISQNTASMTKTQHLWNTECVSVNLRKIRFFSCLHLLVVSNSLT